MKKPAQIITLKAPAKVNLCLAVKYPPVDGYHLLDSVFQELPLHDTLTVELWGIDDCIDSPTAACTQLGTTVDLRCEPIKLATQDNLIFKAVDAIERAFGRTVVELDEALQITVDKRIPAGGGLGGGSSDAAAAIKACCQLMGEDCKDPRALGVAQQLGADVAFFLHGGAALMDNRGDRLVRQLPDFPLPIVLMGEHEGISTAQIYHDFDSNPPTPGDAQGLASAMEMAHTTDGEISASSAENLATLCSNNLEPAAFEALPRLRDRVAQAKQDPDVLHALVTGSGATSYAICPDYAAAERFAARAASYCDWTCIC